VCVCVCHVTDSNPGIVGGAIVVVALVLLAIIGAVVLVRKHRDKQRQKGSLKLVYLFTCSIYTDLCYRDLSNPCRCPGFSKIIFVNVSKHVNESRDSFRYLFVLACHSGLSRSCSSNLTSINNNPIVLVLIFVTLHQGDVFYCCCSGRGEGWSQQVCLLNCLKCLFCIKLERLRVFIGRRLNTSRLSEKLCFNLCNARATINMNFINLHQITSENTLYILKTE